jgi:hypothetical protein
MKSSTVLSVIVVFLALAAGAAAQEASPALQTAGAWFDTANLLVAIACIITSLVIVKKTGKILGRAFVYITASIFVFGSIRFFLYLATVSRQIPISDPTFNLWWHFLFYTAAGVFIGALISLKSSATKPNLSNVFDAKTVVSLVVLLAWVIVIFMTALPLDGTAQALFAGTLWDTSGLIHIIAFIIIGYAWTLLLSLKTLFGKTVTSAVTPFLVGLAFFGLVHLWELLNESWKLIPVAPGVGEFVESVLTLIALASFLKAVWSVRKAIPQGT